MYHQGELTNPQDGQAVRRPLVFGVDLNDLGPDDLVVKLKRPANVLDIKKDARDTGRHSYPLSSRRIEMADLR
jgi:hypothetical protein